MSYEKKNHIIFKGKFDSFFFFFERAKLSFLLLQFTIIYFLICNEKLNKYSIFFNLTFFCCFNENTHFYQSLKIAHDFLQVQAHHDIN